MAVRYSARADRLGGEGASAWKIHAEARRRQAAGDDVIILSVGDPDFSTPEVITRVAIDALNAGQTHYTNLLGLEPLRDAITGYHFRQTGQQVTPDNVCVTAGAQNGLFVASLLCLDPGDEVVVLDPSYVTYEATLAVSGAVAVYASPLPGFRPDPAAIAAAITPRTRAIMFANPNNPTGVAMTADELAAIAGIAREHDLWVFSDEVYATLLFDRPHASIAAQDGMAERTITISSLSKSHAMTGWRLGWVVGPTGLIDHAHNLSLAMHYGLPGYSQAAAVAAIREADGIVTAMRDTYRQRRDVLVGGLADAPWVAALVPDAGMFVLLDVRGTGLSSKDFAWRLLDAEGVSVLDGAAFGPSAAGFVRVSCTINEEALRQAGVRITRFCRSLAGG